MNKESKMYVKNVMKGRGFILDLLNTVLSVTILVMVLLNAIGAGSGLYYMHIFAFGAILTLLNFIKKVRAGSGFAVAFALLTVLLATVAVLCYTRI